MPESKPRYEFRAFAQEFGLVETRLRAWSPVDKIRESSEIYIVSRANNENNTKIRDGLLDIKVFIQEKKGLEQWNPRLKAEFPLNAATIEKEVFPAFGVQMPEFTRDSYTLSQFIEEVIRPHPDLTAVHVFKRRFGFTINDCLAEVAELLVNGAAIKTAAVESTDVEAILEVKRRLGLTDYENVNYLVAIKRIIGMLPAPKDWTR